MPKVTKKLGNNKARAWESLGFAHKKKLCQHFDTTSFLYHFISQALICFDFIYPQFGRNNFRTVVLFEIDAIA